LEDPALKDLTENVLPKNGINNVYYLAGGFSGWKNQEMTTISGGDPFSITDQAKVSYINSDELKKEIENNGNLYIIDLRKSDAFAEGHIKNATNIYLGDLEARQKEIPLGRKIVLVDNDGLWAFKGAVLLFDMNVFNVFSLSDGLDSWKEKNYEVVK
jgi:rhodanese-related sulfurtransferase